ncbi:hypothetical protein AVEN_35559-1 [Araneus ventricosus]|uniref:Uncharacterized protein n=1 Tax=Araneus ventricosus TaxID=182803 RepID=A0A4Y2CJM0_ARAVE|nr:hypothetical protein AVEN_35559-1 [Araneus ventricosus]
MASLADSVSVIIGNHLQRFLQTLGNGPAELLPNRVNISTGKIWEGHTVENNGGMSESRLSPTGALRWTTLKTINCQTFLIMMLRTKRYVLSYKSGPT